MSLKTLIAKPCPYTHLEGSFIGQRCGTPSNGYRCILHAGKKWPEQSHNCKRVITRGKPCNKSTKFQDAICSTCRKCKN